MLNATLPSVQMESQCILWLRYLHTATNTSATQCVSAVQGLALTWLLGAAVIFTSFLAFITARYLQQHFHKEYAEVFNYVTAAGTYQAVVGSLFVVTITCKILQLETWIKEPAVLDATRVVALELFGLQASTSSLKPILWIIMALQCCLLAWLLYKVAAAFARGYASACDWGEQAVAVIGLLVLTVLCLAPQILVIWLLVHKANLLLYFLVLPTAGPPEIMHYLPLISIFIAAALTCYWKTIVMVETERPENTVESKISTRKYYTASWPKHQLFIIVMYGLWWQITYVSFKHMPALPPSGSPGHYPRYFVNGGPISVLLLTASCGVWQVMVTLMYYIQHKMNHKTGAPRVLPKVDHMHTLISDIESTPVGAEDIPLLKA